MLLYQVLPQRRHGLIWDLCRTDKWELLGFVLGHNRGVVLSQNEDLFAEEVSGVFGKIHIPLENLREE